MTKFHALPLEHYHFEDGLLTESSGAPSRHKPFAASASHRWLHCSLSTTPPTGGHRPSGTAAKEGTAAHLLLSWILTHRMLGRRPPIPNRIECEGETFPVERSLVYALSELADIWNAADEVWSEISVAPFPTYTELCGGTTDLAMWTEKTEELHICDLKYGRGLVSEVGNTQLLLYALGAIRHIGRKPRTIHLSIFQPRAPAPHNALRTWSMDPEVLKQHLRPLLDALVRSQETPEHAEAGEWCTWCDHQPTCPTWRAKMSELHEADSEQYETLEELGRLRQALKSWIDEVDDLLKAHLQSGHRLESVKLVAGPGRRRWAVEHSILVDNLPNLIGQRPIDDIFTLKSPAQVEKLITRDHREEFNKLITRGNPSILLVDSSDSRPAIGLGEEFKTNADTKEFE